MGIITLTTDLGYRDPYLALVKARLLAGPADLRIIDLSCEIRSNTISDAAFIVRNSLPAFPPDTIHLVAVKFISDRSSNNRNDLVDNSRFLLTRYAGQYIVSPDNGLFTLLDKDFSEPVYQLYYNNAAHRHFFLKDVFAGVALQLNSGKSMAELGVLTTDYFRALQFESYVSGNILRGKGIYTDDFGNIITNITRQHWDEVIGAKSFSITLPGARISKLSQSYDEVKFGAALILFNSFGYLEVATNGKSAYRMLYPREIGTQFDFTILVEFND